jgi:hypothetical protein
MYVKFINFDAPDAHFDNLHLFSDAQAEKKNGNPRRYDCKDPQNSALKWSQIRRRI